MFRSEARGRVAERKHLKTHTESPTVAQGFKYTKPSRKLLERRGAELPRSSYRRGATGAALCGPNENRRESQFGALQVRR